MHGSGWTGIIEQVDPRVGDHFAPIGRILFESVARGLALDNRGLLVAKGQEPGHDARRRVDIGDRLIGVRVALAHEAAAQQADANFLLRESPCLACCHDGVPFLMAVAGKMPRRAWRLLAGVVAHNHVFAMHGENAWLQATTLRSF
jgi:hypothetical protein